MTHVRTMIGDQAFAAIDEKLVLADGSKLDAYRSRTYPTDANDLPCACLFLPEDVVDDAPLGGKNPGNAIKRRTIRINVPLYFGMPESLENTLETDAEAVLLQLETAMAAEFTLPGPSGSRVATKLRFGGVKSAIINGGSTTMVAFLSTWTALVFHHERDPSVALPMRH